MVREAAVNADQVLRKTTGSYYTPSSLVECLLDTALDPLISEALGQGEPEEALLALTVCDPSCGAGAFLIAAARRLAHHLAVLRTCRCGPPTAAAVAAAKPDVIARCMYGVDLNPLAVDLTRLCLSVEALAPGAPNPALDAHIKCGNALLGTTPALIARGLPDGAFTPITGDDPVFTAALRRRNRVERENTIGES